MSEAPKTPLRGGKRAGAGRKPADPEAGSKKTINLRLAPDVAQLVTNQPPGRRGAYVEAAVRFYEDRRP